MIVSGRGECVPQARLRGRTEVGRIVHQRGRPPSPSSLSEGRETTVRFWRGARTEVREFDARR